MRTPLAAILLAYALSAAIAGSALWLCSYERVIDRVWSGEVLRDLHAIRGR